MAKKKEVSFEIDFNNPIQQAVGVFILAFLSKILFGNFFFWAILMIGGSAWVYLTFLGKKRIETWSDHKEDSDESIERKKTVLEVRDGKKI